MVVETQAVPSLLSKSYYNRLCFLQFDQQIENTILPEEWKEVHSSHIQYDSPYVVISYHIDLCN